MTLAGPPRRRAVVEIDADPPQRFDSDEGDLWLSVIMAALQDAFFRTDAGLRNIDRRADPDLTRGDARRFLTMRWGPWMESRELVCAAAGVDAENLARSCRRKLQALKSGEQTAELDRAFLALVEDADTLDGTALDAALLALCTLENAA